MRIAPLIATLLAALLVAGCSFVPVLGTIYEPGPDKTGLAVKGYCGTVSEGLRDSFRGSLNHHASPHEAYIWCAGDPPPWIGSDRWAAWQANNQEDTDR